MLIKHQALASHLRQRLLALYVLIGQDTYLLNDAIHSIKTASRQRGLDQEEKTLYLNTPADWAMLAEEANSYSLFSDQVLLHVVYDKKSIDATGKETLGRYIKDVNPRCLIILQASNIPAKQLQWLTHAEHTLIVQATPLPPAALQSWITRQLQKRSIRHAQQVPALIHQYSQGNMLACAQVIDKLALISNQDDVLSLPEVMEQLTDQCDYQLYELADACLNANANKAIHLLRQARLNQTEPTLILWLLVQEVRQLIQLSHLLQQNETPATACNKLNIWPQRAKVYQMTLSRLSCPRLYQLLQLGRQLDEQIKTNRTIQVWHSLEQLALSLCLAHHVSR